MDANPAGSVKVERVDERSIVLHFEGEKQSTHKTKFIFDVSSKRLLKQWNIPLRCGDILTLNGQLYAVVGHPEQMAIVRLDEGKPIQVTGAERDSVLARAEEKPLSDGGDSLPIGSQGQFKVRQVSQARTHGGTDEVTVIAEQVGDETQVLQAPQVNL